MYVMTHMLPIVCSMTGPLSFLLVSLPSFLLRLVLILSSSLLVHILSFHFHHLHLQLRPANLKNFKLRLHFELETQFNNLLSFPISSSPSLALRSLAPWITLRLEGVNDSKDPPTLLIIHINISKTIPNSRFSRNSQNVRLI